MPGAADRIFRMAEDNERSRNDAVERLSKAEARSVTVASVSFSLAPIVMAGATIFAIERGADSAAAVAAVAAALSTAPKVLEALRRR